MEIRKQGWKSKFNFDEIDCYIMELIIKEQPLGILEIRGKLNLPHNNLKRHLDKLEKAKLIKREKQEKGNKVLVYLNEKVYTPEVVRKLLEILKNLKN